MILSDRNTRVMFLTLSSREPTTYVPPRHEAWKGNASWMYIISQTDLSPKVIVCPLLFKKHSTKRCLCGRDRAGEGRSWGFLKLPALAKAGC